MTTGPGPSPAGAARVRPAAGAITRVSTLVLPSGPVRSRYRDEHRAELSALDPKQQVPYAVGALMSAWALRGAVTKEDTMAQPATPRKPLLCRLNLHHHWVRRGNPDGGSYRACSRCGKDHPSIGTGSPDIMGSAHF